jgi:hypothetical protein
MTIQNTTGDMTYQSDGFQVLFLDRTNRQTTGFKYSFEGEPLVFITPSTTVETSAAAFVNTGFFFF